MLRKPGALIAIFGIAGLVLAGCGSSSPNRPAATATAPARQAPLTSSPGSGGGRHREAHPAAARRQGAHPASALGQLAPSRPPSTVRADKSRITTAKVVQARQAPGSSNEKSATGAKPLNPCTLVSLSEAQAITGGAVTKMIEAPLGPTCIYSGTGRAAGVTLALETERFSEVTRHMTASKHVVIGGRGSVCGRLGTQMLFVPLGRNQLLNVTAPCGIAQRFATVAVSRLSA